MKYLHRPICLLFALWNHLEAQSSIQSSDGKIIVITSYAVWDITSHDIIR